MTEFVDNFSVPSHDGQNNAHGYNNIVELKCYGICEKLNRNNLAMKCIATGFNRACLSITFQNTSNSSGEMKLYLPPGTVWLTKAPLLNAKYQQMIQRDAIDIMLVHRASFKAFCYCGDRSASIPSNIEYYPTCFRYLGPLQSQDELWKVTQTYTNQKVRELSPTSLC